MTSIHEALPKFAEIDPVHMPDGFEAAEVVVPTSVDEVAEVLRWATEHEAVVVPFGGGTHQGLGDAPPADIVLSLGGLAGIEVWEPDDLTVVARPGLSVADLEAELAGRGQTALLPEVAGGATVGGVVATAVSGYRRGRYGPTRDRVLEVTTVTGDGRVVRGGARVVKNVTGYDLPRLATGSLGALGVIVSVCLKLWPLTEAAATVTVDDVERAREVAWRPLAILETREGARVFLGGTGAEVEAQVRELGGAATSGLDWPRPVRGAAATWSIRVPPDLVGAALAALPPGWDYVAQHGVGEITVADPDGDPGTIRALRSWAESAGGSLVRLEAPNDRARAIDPWGTPPSDLDLQRRIVAAFDPARIVNRGRLPGGI